MSKVQWIGIVAAVLLSASISRAATIFTEDFESGLGSWTSNAGTATTAGNPQVVAAPSAPPDAPGSLLSFTDPDGAVVRVGRGFTTTAGATSAKLTYYVYSSSNASSQRYYGQLSNGTAAAPGAGTGGFFRIAANNDAASKWDALYSNGATQTLVTPTVITVGWHKMQLTVTPGAANVGSFTYQIDANSPVTTVSTGAVLMPTNAQFGQNVSNGTVGAPDTSAFFDSVLVEQFAPAAAIAAGPGPADLATSVDPDQDLSWAASANATSYKVYLDTNPTPTTLVATQAGTTFDPGTLADNTTYYWRVDARNLLGDATTGTVWSFTTGSVPEPASMGLLALAGLGLLRRRRGH